VAGVEAALEAALEAGGGLNLLNSLPVLDYSVAMMYLLWSALFQRVIFLMAAT